MSIDETLAAVAARWAAERIDFGPPATPEEVAAFEARYSVAMPDDVRAYFLTLNGFADAPPGREGLRFRPLVEVCRVPDEESRGHGGYFAFADDLARSTSWVVSLWPDASQDAWVALVDGPVVAPLDPGLGAFLERYLAGAVPAICPEPPPDTRSPARRWLDRAWLRVQLRWYGAFEFRPRLRNRRPLEAELERFIIAHLKVHPELRRERTATVTLRLRIDEHGAAEVVEVVRPCLQDALNDAAVRIGERMRFRPARVGLTRVPVLVDITLTFSLRGPRPW